MINELAIIFDPTILLPDQWAARLFAMIVGCTIVAHFWMMAYYGKTHAPWPLKALFMLLAGIGADMVVRAINGGPEWSPDAALYASPLIAFLLLVWKYGFHVCELVEWMRKTAPEDHSNVIGFRTTKDRRRMHG